MAIITLTPMLLAVLNSFKTNGEIYTNILSLPTTWQINNYIDVFRKTHYLRSLMNTVFLVVLSVSGIVFVSSLAGYKLARTKTRLSQALFVVFILSMLIPFHSIMIGLVRVANQLKVQGSLWGLALIYVGIGSPMAIFFYHGFTKNVPREIEEAAMIDGCNGLQLYFRIVFPLLRPITYTIVILNTLWIWNDFLLPLLMISNREKHTLLLSTQALFGQYSANWSQILAILIMAMLPVMIVYLFIQKHIVSGIAEGALKS
ncbi:MAG: carbohydrate ABC transporter permease [Acholeplasmatales bacterium]|nr:MAG: carbohydrate ABC transporter permease [Acholeplasmatales bacterium]